MSSEAATEKPSSAAAAPAKMEEEVRETWADADTRARQNVGSWVYVSENEALVSCSTTCGSGGGG